LSKKIRILGIPNIEPRDCVLIVQIGRQTGPHKCSFSGLELKECSFMQWTTSCKNHHHLQILRCLCTVL
jgi:hypothetical protein